MEKEKKQKIITRKYESSCNVYHVYLDDELVMRGNPWDFHPDCHGIYKYGKFNGCWDLIYKMKTYYTKEGFNVFIDYVEIS